MEERLARLERANRQLRAAVLGLVLLVGSALLLGAAVPDSARVLRCSALLLIDASGEERGSIMVNGEDVAMTLYGPAGEPGAQILCSPTKASIGVYSSEGQHTVGMHATTDTSAVIGMYRGEMAYSMSRTDRATHLFLNRPPRAFVGLSAYSEQAMAAFTVDGERHSLLLNAAGDPPVGVLCKDNGVSRGYGVQ